MCTVFFSSPFLFHDTLPRYLPLPFNNRLLLLRLTFELQLGGK